MHSNGQAAWTDHALEERLRAERVLKDDEVVRAGERAFAELLGEDIIKP